MIPILRWIVCLAAFLVPWTASFADGSVVAVRVGTHDGYGRVVFDLPSQTQYRVTQQGQTVLIQFTEDLKIGTTPLMPRNVLGIAGGAGQVELIVARGVTLRDWRLGDRLVIDVVDATAEGGAAPAQRAAAGKPSPAKPLFGPPPPPAAAPTPASSPPATPAPPSEPNPLPRQETNSPPAVPERAAPSAPPAPDAAPSAPVTVVQQITPAPVTPAPVTSASNSPTPVNSATAVNSPTPVTETRVTTTPVAPPPAPPAPVTTSNLTEPAASPDPRFDAELVVPTPAQTGLAMFHRGETALIVFDQRLPIDLTALRAIPAFGSATQQPLPAATVIRVVLDPGMALAATRAADAWHITATQREATLRPIQATVANDRMLLSAQMPGSVVTLTDPDTGAILLVGTQRRDGQGVPAQRRTPEFSLLPTWQGVAVEANAETVALRPTQQGFVLAGNLVLSPLVDIADQLVRAVGLTKRFEFANQPSETLMQRMRREMTEDALTPPLARGPRRQALARTMLSLGLGAEAGATLRMAAADDPHEAGAADNAALTAVAAVLAFRPREAEGLADPRLEASDDITLWRAMRLAQLHPGSPTAAAMLAATLPLLLTYPPAMRDRMLPLVAETLVMGGETAVAGALLKARAGTASLDLARAMLQEAEGDTAGALASYDRLVQSRDQSAHVRAAIRAVELRLATGVFDARQAADRLAKLLYAWRGDQHERALRERLAELEARAGSWRFALTLLRESEALFPDDKAALHAALGDMFAALLRDDAADAVAPLEFVSIVEENADLLPAGAEGAVLQARLADRLVALDLPKRAGPVLEKLMQAGNPLTRARFGTRLATLRLREGDPAGAVAALEASNAADLPADVIERRALVLAAANARRGDADRALSVLSALDSAAADEARAAILERANDWPAAQRALAGYVTRTVPRDGTLDEAQRRTLLRLATAAARAGDDAALADLRQREMARMGMGPLADMFKLLTAPQVRNVGDLRRAGQETALARALPVQLKTLQQPAPQPP